MSLIWSVLLSASFFQSSAQKIPLDNYTIQNGLPQNTVYDIDQDQQGYIWFATQVGAARFDGYEFANFNSTNGLPDDNVNCLMVDKQGNVWLGTEKGVAVFDGTEFSIYTEADGLVNNRVDDLLEDTNGNIWVTTAYGLSVITEDKILSYSQDNALVDNSITKLFVDSEGSVYVATFPGLTIFQDPYSFEKFHEEKIIRDIMETSSGEIWYATQGDGIILNEDKIESKLWISEGMREGTVFTLLEDSEKRIWISTYEGGLYVYEDGHFDKVSQKYGMEILAADFYEDTNHRIWIRTFEDGIWLYDDGDFKHITAVNNLAHNNVRDIFEDKYGNIWFGTLDGVSKHGRVIFEIFDMDTGLPENPVASVYIDSRDRIWFGTYSSLLSKKNVEIQVMDSRRGFPDHAMPLSFAEDNNNMLFIGTDVGLFVYDGSRFSERLIKGLDKEIERGINSLIFTPDGSLWCATDSGIAIIHEKKVLLLGSREGLVNDQVNSLDRLDDRICCSTEGGISLFSASGEHIRNFTLEDGLVSDVCIDATFDSEGNIWVATNKGLTKIGADLSSVITRMSKQNGLSSNTIYFVEFLDKHSLWIGTERGLNVLNTRTKQIDFYGFEDGFHPLETNARAIARGIDGDLWIGTVGGLVHYLPQYNVKDSIPPNLILFPPVVNGEILESKSRITELPYNKNSLEFRYTGIHTTNPQKNKFSSILEGYDEEWSVPGTEREAEYKKLPNGSYVFRVKAYNLDGIEVDQESRFAFTILPPFWKRVWFIILEVFIGIMLVWGFIKYRERKLIQEKKILESKVKTRTREIEDQKQEIEAQRDEISIQKSFVEEQRDKIVEQNKEITDSIHYAKRIQQAVLPGKHILERSLPDHFILFKPRDIVSGDFYWVEEKDGLIIACAADCTGHGVPGAFMSMLGLTFLHEIVNKDGIVQANEILNRLRSYIIRALSKKDELSETRDGMDLSLVVIDREKQSLEFAGAYNPLVLVRDGQVLVTKGDKMPIGKHFGEEGPFTNHLIDLKNRDMIYMFSDGFQDQFGGEKDSKYKSKPLLSFLHNISTESVENQLSRLDEEFLAWKGKTEQVDDVIILGIRYNSKKN